MAAGLAWGGTSVTSASKPARYTPTSRDYYINYVEPKVERFTDGREVRRSGSARPP